jgi:hypothetical protein
LARCDPPQLFALKLEAGTNETYSHRPARMGVASLVAAGHRGYTAWTTTHSGMLKIDIDSMYPAATKSGQSRQRTAQEDNRLSDERSEAKEL